MRTGIARNARYGSAQATIGAPLAPNNTHESRPDFQRRRRLVRLAIWLAVALVFAPWYALPLDNADSSGMLAHLHAYAVDRDLLYDNEYRSLRMSPLFAFVTTEGVVSNHWNTGATFLQLPGYLAGRSTAAALADRMGKSAQWLVPVFVLRYVLALITFGALEALVRRLRDDVGTLTAALIAACLAVGTPLAYYVLESPLRPHAWGALVVLGIVLLWMRPAPSERREQLLRVAAMGGLVGLATAIRPQLAPLWLLVGLDAWTMGEDRPAKLRLLGAAALAASVWPLTQWSMVSFLYGSPSTAVAMGSTHYFPGKVLLSPYHGALVWCPVLGLGMAGLVLGGVGKQKGAWLLLALFVLQILVNAGDKPIEPLRVLGTRTWGGGTAFGPRKLLDSTPLLIPGAVWGAKWLEQRPFAARAVAALAVVCCLWTLTLLAAVVLDPTVASHRHDWASFGQALGRPFSGGYGAALRPRKVTAGVALWGMVFAGLPTLLCVAAAYRVFERRRLEWLTGIVLVGGLVANGWVAVLRVRSDAALGDDPGRMQQAQQQMLGAHRYMVGQIPPRE